VWRLAQCLALSLSLAAACTCLGSDPGAEPVGGGERDPLVSLLRDRALPLRTAEDLAPLVERAGDARLVLLGEASHGTSEFYTWRTAMSRRLAEDQGISFIAVEGDWPAALAAHHYVTGAPGAAESAREALAAFAPRWPAWMWKNHEVLELVEWLREHNAGLAPEERIGFYGMDVYGASLSIQRLRAFFAERAPAKAARAEEKLGCMTRFGELRGYSRSLAQGGSSCEEPMQRLVELVVKAAAGAAPGDRFEAEQEAVAVANAERYYRASAEGAGWNARVDHMFETVNRLLEHHGPGARGVVWAHNTHVGDARATSMVKRGQRNIGQLAREAYGTGLVYAVGFGTHRGEVIAGRRWGGPVFTMQVPPAAEGSIEDALHRTGEPALLLVFDDGDRQDALLGRRRGHRAIGVIYDPEREQGNYVPTLLPARYDAFLFIDETRPLRPL
jgi:erythromycin esterase